jgi:hypothetical protein
VDAAAYVFDPHGRYEGLGLDFVLDRNGMTKKATRQGKPTSLGLAAILGSFALRFSSA